VQHLHDRHAGVEADQVGQRQRAHRMGEPEPGDGVDRLRLRDPLEQRIGGLVDERHQDPVGDEPGQVARLRRRLAELRRELRDRRGRLVGGLEAADHLDELQHRHRIEEMHADDAVRSLRRRGERRDRDRGGVGGEDRSVGQRLVGATEDLLLDGGVLDHGLDQQVGAEDLVRGLDAAQHLRRVGAALLVQLRQRALDRREAALDGTGRCVVERDAAAGGRDDLGDAAAHLAGADDEDVLEVHDG
jgi:hypothetical protein